jgi:hypothetical protein
MLTWPTYYNVLRNIVIGKMDIQVYSSQNETLHTITAVRPYIQYSIEDEEPSRCSISVDSWP